MEKSHVSMEQHWCPVCGTTYDSGAILLDRCLRKSLEPKTITQAKICSECQSKLDEGFTILIVVRDGEGEKNPKNPYRTGELLYFKPGDGREIVKGNVAYIEESETTRLKEQQLCQELTE